MKVLQRVNADTEKVRPYQPGKPIEEAARELGLDPDQFLKLASNESALGVAPSAIKAMKAACEEMFLYPDAAAWRLRQKLAKMKNMAPEQFVFGAGSNEVLVFLAQVFMGQGKSIVASQYSFAVYKILSVMSGTDFIEVPANDNLGHDLKAMAAAIRPDTSIVFVTNPNNPTGTMVDQQQLDDFVAAVPEDCLIVFDEAYAEICLAEMPDTLKYIREKRACIVLRTFSKAYGLAGLRVGYGIADEQIITELGKVRQPFNVNLMAMVAAEAALEDEDFLKASVANYLQARSDYEQFFEQQGLRYIRPYGNFILFEIEEASDVAKKLEKQGVLVRPLVPYGLKNWLRVTFGTAEQNGKFFKSLALITAK